MTRYLLCVGLMVLAGAWAHAQAIGIALQYQTTNADEQFSPPNGNGTIKLDVKPPSGVKAPEAKGTVMYGQITLGTRAYALALCADKQQRFSTCIVDVNCNRDLTDDAPWVEPANVFPGGSDYLVQWNLRDLKSEVAGHEMPFDGGFMYQSGAPTSGFVFASGSYAGEFTAGGKKYTFVLCDGNANGVYGEIVTMGGEGDVFLVGETGAIDDMNRFALGKYVSLDGTLYEVATEPGAPKVILTPSKDGVQALPLALETQRLQLYNQESGVVLSCYRPGAKVSVPKGDYRIDRYQLLRKDEAGAVWSLQAVPGQAPILAGADGKAVVYGEPFRPSVAVMKTSEAVSAELEFTIVGAGGERVDWLTRLTAQPGKIEMSAAKPDRPVEPMYRVVTPDGEVVAQGSFEYG